MCYGTEFTSMAILRWCQETGVEWHYIAPGKPTQNAFVAVSYTHLDVYKRQESVGCWSSCRVEGADAGLGRPASGEAFLGVDAVVAETSAGGFAAGLADAMVPAGAFAAEVAAGALVDL